MNIYFPSQRNIKSVRQLINLPDDKRRALLRSLSDEQYRDILIVSSSMPYLELSYRCEVSDSFHAIDVYFVFMIIVF